jgi:general secretion pathway protein I
LKTGRPAHIHCRNGFTLLEVMAALAMIAIALIAVYKMQAQTISMNAESRFYTVAPQLAQRKMAEIDIKDQESLTDESGDFGDDFPGYTYNVSVEELISDRLEAVAKDLKKIDVIIRLNADENIYRIRTYRFMPQ